MLGANSAAPRSNVARIPHLRVACVREVGVRHLSIADDLFERRRRTINPV